MANRISTWNREQKITEILLDTPNKVYTLKSPDFPTDRWMSGIRITFEGRIKMPAAAGPATVLADAPYSILDVLIFKAFYIPSNREEQRFKMRCRSLARQLRVWNAVAPTTYPASLSVAADAANDISFSVDIPAFPVHRRGGNGRLREKLDYLWDMPAMRQVELSVAYADWKSLFSGGGANAPTVTAYGADVGSPRLMIHGLFAIGGDSKFAGVRPASVWRNEFDLSDLTVSGDGKKLLDLPRGFDLRSIFLQTGSPAVGTTGANKAFATLSDSILNNVQVRLGLDRPIRHTDNFRVMRHNIAASYGMGPDLGCALIDFCQDGTRAEVLKTAGLVIGPTSEVDLSLYGDVVGAAGQAGTAVTEEFRGEAVWPGDAARNAALARAR